MLSLNDEAWAALQARGVSGEVRLGLQEDFGEVLLPAVLGQFSRACPEVEIAVTVTRNAPLREAMMRQELDLALSWEGRDAPVFDHLLGRLPLQWIAAAAFDVARYLDSNQPLPLLAFEAPCVMRTAATAALDKAGIPWRIAFTGVVCGRGRNPTLRLWPTIFSGKIDVFPGDRRSRLISSMTSVAPA